MDNLSGGTTNLLRMARSECRAAAAFVALALDDDMFATATYRAVPDDELFRSEAVDDLIRQAWADPEFGQGKALVRVARLGGRRLTPAKRMALAILPLVDGPGARPWGLLGVAGPETGSFDAVQIELLGRIAQRLSSYFRARQEVRQRISRDVDVQAQPTPAQPSATPVGTIELEAEPSWTVTPPPGAPAPAPAPPAPAPAPAPPAPAPAPPPSAAAGWTAVIEPQEPEQPPSAPEVRWGVQPPSEPEIQWGEQPPSAPEVRWGEQPPSAPEVQWGQPAPGAAGQARQPEAEQAKPEPASDQPSGVAPGGSHGSDALGELLRGEDPVTGLLPLGALLGRTGRMLGAAMAGGGALAMVVIELVADDRLDDTVLLTAAHALRGELRFDDPVARIGQRAFAAVVPLVPGGSGGKGVEEHLAGVVRSAIASGDVAVRSAHLLASLDERKDADDLLRAAVAKLRAE